MRDADMAKEAEEIGGRRGKECGSLVESSSSSHRMQCSDPHSIPVQDQRG